MSTLSDIAGQLEAQSQTVYLREKLDSIPEKGECHGQCNGHPNWSVTEGYLF
ncbi:MAG: hypothetical protein ACI935_000398 [Moritella dasanensis]|jgi:hypothetical protein